MKKAIYIIILTFYAFGTFCLPLGDFAVLPDLPQMYQHCKTTEDKDMTPFDFITDHLMNIDCIFDKHDNGDEQKPHTPIQFHHSQMQNTFVAQHFEFNVNKPLPIINTPSVYAAPCYHSDYIFKVFRPPIV